MPLVVPTIRACKPSCRSHSDVLLLRGNIWLVPARLFPRVELRGQGPANAGAAESPEVQAAPAIAALLAQSEFSQLQRVGGKFWDPVAEFAGNMARGNPSGADLQAQLDHLVESVTAR